ncbi:vacuolar protein sorting-associated protein 33A-like [Apostichopus japonicus]|uniref:vacuolar protein sorting-associated protein 33A-like n=1 Tax=Stichopus japonicus TaxID=307972 RepID=UPI003AB637EC
MSSHLSGGRVNLALWRNKARSDLLRCLRDCPGSKALVWDHQLTGPVGLIAEYSLLRENEVDRMFPLNPGRLPIATGAGASAIQSVIFLVRPKLELIEVVADCIRKTEEVGSRFHREYNIYFVPMKSTLCCQKLKDLQVYGFFKNVGEYCLELLPLDSDLLSMESEVSFKECYLLNDFTTMHYVARALMKMQAMYGIIPKVYGKGKCAKTVADMITRMRREIGDGQFRSEPCFDSMLLLDRTCDLLTPLPTQLTYEGLIDEFFDLQNGTAKFPPEKFSKGKDSEEQQQQKDLSTEKKSDHKKIPLNSSDELFAVLRDKNFNAVGPELSKKAKTLSAIYDERKDARTVRAMKQFVSKLPHIQLEKSQLATHTSIAELIKEQTDTDVFMDSLQVQQEFMNGIDTDKINSYVEDSIAKKEPLINVLRILCLQSVTNDGFKPKVFDFYRREILQTYGFHHMLTLSNLERAGLLKVQGNRSFPALRKTLNLMSGEVNELNPQDISYVFSGYAPLSVRLVQTLVGPGWRSIQEVMRLLPGQTFEIDQKLPTGVEKTRPITQDNHGEQSKVCLVFFLGGVTAAEIAALRFLSQQENSVYGSTEFIVATTKLLNGSNWIESLMENPIPVRDDGNPRSSQQSRLR